MAQPFVGQIIPVGFNFAPVGWLPCDGRTVAISDYETLFVLIGTTYGGDGQVTFGLPNLSGRVALGAGQGGGLSPYVPGQTAGTEAVTLNGTQLGDHTHAMNASSAVATLNVPSSSAVFAASPDGEITVYGPSVAGVAMAPAAISSAGGATPHENRQPFITVNYIIATVGVFPQQS